MYKKNFFIISFIYIVTSFFTIGSFFIAAFSFQSLINLNLKNFVFYSILDILFILTAYLLNFFNLYLTIKRKERISLVILNQIIKRQILHNDSEKVNHGKFSNWIKNDLPIIKDELLIIPFLFIDRFFKIIFTLAAILYFSWIVGISMLLLILISTLTIYKLSPKIETLDYDFSLQEEKYLTNVQTELKSLKYLYFFNKVNVFQKRIQRTIANKQEIYLNYIKKNFKFSFFIYFFSLAPQVIIILLISLLAYWGYAIYGSIISVGFMVGYFFSNTSDFINKAINFKKSKKIFKKHFYFLKDYYYKKKLDNVLSINNIRIKNLTIKTNKKILIKKFNYLFEKNKKYLIIGSSGIGKTILIKTLLGIFKEYDGEIIYDKKNLKNINQNSIWNHVEYLESKNFVFYDSFINNISLWEKNPNIAKIKNIVKNLNFFDLNFQNLNQKITSKNGLSEGEKQILNLIRGLYFNKKIWIIDEAFNNVDKNKIVKIENLLFAKKIMLIYISHDTNYVKKFDQIINLKDWS